LQLGVWQLVLGSSGCLDRRESRMDAGTESHHITGIKFILYCMRRGSRFAAGCSWWGKKTQAVPVPVARVHILRVNWQN